MSVFDSPQQVRERRRLWALLWCVPLVLLIFCVWLSALLGYQVDTGVVRGFSIVFGVCALIGLGVYVQGESAYRRVIWEREKSGK